MCVCISRRVPFYFVSFFAADVVPTGDVDRYANDDGVVVHSMLLLMTFLSLRLFHLCSFSTMLLKNIVVYLFY